MTVPPRRGRTESPDPGPDRVVFHPHGLELTSFVGRERAVEELDALLAGSRLLTLTGAGGSGKSRLAARVASAASDRLGLRCVPVELAAISDPVRVARHVSDAFGFREEVRGGDPALLAGLIGETEALLLLDNCEHLVDRCAELAEILLQRCPGIRILATSREALGVRGERAWLVPPLEIPASDDLEEIRAAEAVRLFEARARDVVAGWEVGAGNAAAVAEICRRLDGIPLAIELAAARVRHLPVAEIRDRLDDAFRLLTSSDRSALPRHRTLRATMDWSHDLLTEDQRGLLRRLSVFRGGFSLDAVERISTADGVDEDPLERLAQLVDRSMVVLGEDRGRARYRLLETVRQYAAGRLEASGEGDRVSEVHAEWVADLVRTAEPHLIRRERPEWVRRLDAELQNLRAALEWSRSARPVLHVELVGRLWWYWFSSQYWTEAARWIQGALELPAAQGATLDRARLLFAAGALAALRAAGEVARPLLEEAVKLAEACGDPRLRAYAVNYLGLSRAGEGDVRARVHLEEAATWFEREGDDYGLRLSLLLLGSTALGEGDVPRAEAYNREGVAVARRFGLPRELAVSLQNLAVVHLASGRHREAAPIVAEGMAASVRDPSIYFISTGMQYAAEVLAAEGRDSVAARMFGAADGLRETIGSRPFEIDRERLESALGCLRDRMGPAFEGPWAEGRGLDLVGAATEALRELEALVQAGPGAPATVSPAHEPPALPEPDALPESDDLSESDALPESDVRPGSASLPAMDTGSVVDPAASGRPAEAPVATADPGLRVRVLGGFEVEVDGIPLPETAFPYARPRELLLLLLLHPRGRSRDQIGDLLWPGSTTAQVTNSLHVTVHHLRKALGRSEWIDRDGDRYRIHPEVPVDFDADRLEAELRAALAEPDQKRARALLDGALDQRGDWLGGDAAPGWIEDARDRLRALRVDAALRLGSILEEEGRWDEAAARYSDATAWEELNEELHRRLMHCWAEAGHRPRAVRHYERLERMLREALDCEPEDETRELAASLKG